MNRLKADQKTKVGKRKQDPPETLSEAEYDVKKCRAQNNANLVGVSNMTSSQTVMPITHLSYASSSSQGLAQSSILSKNCPKNYENILRQFVQWTQATEPVSLNFLAKANWNIEYAMTLYYDNPNLFSSSAPATVDQSKTIQLFTQYVDKRDGLGERIGPHGMQRLLIDLGYEPIDRRVLILAWVFKAETQCEFSLQEFTNGMASLQVDSIQGLKQKIDALDAGMKADLTKTRDLCIFTFNYGKSAASRSLDLEMAICYWDVIFGARKPLMSQWIDFLYGQERMAYARLEEDRCVRTRMRWNIRAIIKRSFGHERTSSLHFNSKRRYMNR
ncbi:hypothetical protein L5515_004076 [Caenorhabditis briggsae]|uniref:Defective in cullin neddylation protein n=1 Tax=Caenorhabditis briggsae TaxID=6238 RepID=A0AAE9DBX5_CAEBR|nr:hypothetical protein L3Y34_001219 [Caenorhabditis briggsae]UMM23274.1 hypothetical protein L5515_004076 [Caenorhabditis briggsae]